MLSVLLSIVWRKTYVARKSNFLLKALSQVREKQDLSEKDKYVERSQS